MRSWSVMSVICLSPGCIMMSAGLFRTIRCVSSCMMNGAIFSSVREAIFFCFGCLILLAFLSVRILSSRVMMSHGESL